MPELNWIGKQAVRAHHREVDFHLLKDVPELACEGSAGTPARSGEADMSVRAPLQDGGNLIVQGDNLRALKALLPRYAGQVKCIYIDPPYNTGNEGWVYNDNVKAPEMVKWLGQVVGKEAEDLSRHDKWLCMMYPRLQLLKRFLREDGSIWISIDDNEAASLKLLMDEVFGAANFVTTFVWRKVDSPNDNKVTVTPDHEHIVCYSKCRTALNFKRKADPAIVEAYGMEDEKGCRYRDRLLKKNGKNSLRTDRPTMFFPLTAPDGTEVLPIHDDGREARWAMGLDTIKELEARGDLIWKNRGDEGAAKWIPYSREYAPESPERPWPTIWADLHTSRQAKAMLSDLFPGTEAFPTPKPVDLIQRILQIASDKDSFVLDSFAGSGTTGHAVLKQNAEDGGTRRFILVEMEEKIARTITAERVRRVVERSDAGTPARTASEETADEVEAEAPSEAGELDLFAASAAKKSKKKRTAVSESPELRAGVPASLQQQAGVPASRMPGFRFAVLGETLFDAEGNIRETVTFDELAEFVWFQQTGAPLPPKPEGERTPLLGIHRGAAVYLLYNGILKDKSVGGGNVLTRPVLYALPPHDGPKVVWCAACRISEYHKRRLNVTEKQIPDKLEVNAWL
jgi:adenine-specific DNA-methyltransferase